MVKQHRNVHFKSISIDTETHARLKQLAGRRPLATYLREHTLKLVSEAPIDNTKSQKTLRDVLVRVEDLARQVDQLWDADRMTHEMEDATDAGLRAALPPEVYRVYEKHSKLRWRLGAVKYSEMMERENPTPEPDWNAVDWDKAPSAAALFNMRNGNKGEKGA